MKIIFTKLNLYASPKRRQNDDVVQVQMVRTIIPKKTQQGTILLQTVQTRVPTGKQTKIPK